MQPFLSTEHPTSMIPQWLRNDPMTAATSGEVEPPSSPAGLGLRLAQRAFAACIEDATSVCVKGSSLHAARLRSKARRTLSALSADDRSRLDKWLSLQFATAFALDGTVESRWLGRVNSRLDASVRAMSPTLRDQLSAPPGDGAAA